MARTTLPSTRATRPARRSSGAAAAAARGALRHQGWSAQAGGSAGGLWRPSCGMRMRFYVLWIRAALAHTPCDSFSGGESSVSRRAAERHGAHNGGSEMTHRALVRMQAAHADKHGLDAAERAVL
jgi:hypothetical protein